MTSCDEFEIEIEKWLHGALSAAEAQQLQAHLSTCSRCRAFEAAARRTEASMRGQADEALGDVDWGRVDEAISAWRRRSTTLLGTWAVLGAVLAAQAWRHRGEQGPAGYARLAAGLFLLALGVRVVVTVLRRRRMAALEHGSQLLDVLRTDLHRRRGATWMSLAIFPLLAGFFVWEGLESADPSRRPLFGVAALICVGTWLAVWLVKRPRLAREQAVLDGTASGNDA